MAEFNIKITNPTTTDEALQRLFQSHDLLTDEQTNRCDAIRKAGLELSRVIMANASAGADRTAALRKLREVVWTAGAAIRSESKPEAAAVTA